MDTKSYTAASTIPGKLFCDPDFLYTMQKDKYIKPIHIQINPDNRCPLNCKFCSCKNRNKELHLEYDNMVKITDKFINLGTKAVTMSVTGDELVLLEKDGFLSLTPIKDIVENKDEYKDINSWSYDNNNFVCGNITKFFKHKADKIFKITLNDGRNIKVTGDHSLYFYENDNIVNKIVRDVKINDKLVICNVEHKKEITSIDVSKFSNITRRGVKNPGSFPITPELCRLLGYFVAEGTLDKKNYSLTFTFGPYTGIEKKYIDDAFNICKILGFGKNSILDFTYTNTTSLRLYSKWFVEMVKSIGVGGHVHFKRVPDIIFNMNKNNQIEFLKGLFAGDGNFRSTMNSKLENTNKHLHQRNVLIIKTSSSILCKTLGFLFDNMNVNYTVSEGMNKERMIENRVLAPSKYYGINIYRKDSLFKLIEVINFMGKDVKYRESKYSCYKPKIKNTYINENVFALDIKKIEEIEYDDYVYDIEVKDTHKFITSYGILAHNTGGGDPLAYPHLGKYIDYLSNRRIKTGLVTNGVLFNKIEDKSFISKLTWCRVSLSDEYKLLTDALKNTVRDYHTDWSFSYVITKDFTLDNFIKSIEFANEYKFTHVRLVDDILSFDEKRKYTMEDIKRLVKNLGVDDSKVIYQGRKEFTKGHKKCLISLLKPNIGPDGNIYPCCGFQFSKVKQSLDLVPSESMGNDIEKIWENQDYYNGSVCDVCYYSDYNNILNTIIDSDDLKHKDFI